VLSGFVISYNYARRFETFDGPSYASFLRARVARVYPVHLVTLLCVLPMVLIALHKGWQLNWEGYTAAQFVQNLFLVQTWVPYFKLNWNYPAWSISAEWLLYLVFPLIAIGLAKIRGKRAAWAAVVASVVVSVVLWPIINLSSHYNIYRALLQFVTGALIFKLFMLTSPRQTERRGLILIALTALLVLVLMTSDHLEQAVMIVFPLFILSLTCLRGRDPVLSSRPLMTLGEVSYSLYMTHALVQKITLRVLPSQDYAASGLVTRLGVLGCYALMVIAATGLLYRFVEKPARSWLKR
jgi:peptidoglycan/LPS O-acetylase OafA/YrhL